jgi:hypothetical protein
MEYFRQTALGPVKPVVSKPHRAQVAGPASTLRLSEDGAWKEGPAQAFCVVLFRAMRLSIRSMPVLVQAARP